jgi:hypothetical protein
MAKRRKKIRIRTIHQNAATMPTGTRLESIGRKVVIAMSLWIGCYFQETNDLYDDGVRDDKRWDD